MTAPPYMYTPRPLRSAAVEARNAGTSAIISGVCNRGRFAVDFEVQSDTGDKCPFGYPAGPVGPGMAWCQCTVCTNQRRTAGGEK
jgi:hypothetical protein